MSGSGESGFCDFPHPYIIMRAEQPRHPKPAPISVRPATARPVPSHPPPAPMPTLAQVALVREALQAAGVAGAGALLVQLHSGLIKLHELGRGSFGVVSAVKVLGHGHGMPASACVLKELCAVKGGIVHASKEYEHSKVRCAAGHAEQAPLLSVHSNRCLRATSMRSAGMAWGVQLPASARC